MSVTLLLAILGLTGTLIGAGAAFLAQRHAKAANAMTEKHRLQAEAKAKQQEETAVLVELRELRTLVTAVPEQIRLVAKATIVDLLEPVRKIIWELQAHGGVIDGKLELVFKSLEGLADDVAQYVMHHPDPTRARFDYLLEHYKARTLTADEELEFRRALDAVMKYNPGDDIGFNVYPGESFGAAIMLHTMDLFKMRRELEKKSNG